MLGNLCELLFYVRIGGANVVERGGVKQWLRL